jgi:hypothetical protein
MKKAAWVIAFALAVSEAPSFAGGTLGTDQLVPLMEQKPAVYDALKKSLEFSDSAWAWVRFGDSWPKLNGARMGPYEIEATVRGSKEKALVVLCTKPTYFDSSDHKLPDLTDQAASFNEELTTVMLEQTRESNQAPLCPGN